MYFMWGCTSILHLYQPRWPFVDRPFTPFTAMTSLRNWSHSGEPQR